MDFAFTVGVGGAMCVLLDANHALGPPFKQFAVTNATIAEFPEPGAPGWACVVCNYDQPGGAIPALSALGTAVLIGGLLTAGIYEIRRRQRKVAAA